MAFKVFIAESNNPGDFYAGRLDGFAANEVLKVGEIESRYRVILNREMLKRAIEEAHEWDATIFHLCCHGSKKGVKLTCGQSISWDEIAKEFQSFATGERTLINSICYGGDREVAKAFKKAQNKFGYICGPKETVYFPDSCIAWSILYNILSDKNLDNDKNAERSAFRESIKKINKVIKGKFVYLRWNDTEKKYLQFTGRTVPKKQK